MDYSIFFYTLLLAAPGYCVVIDIFINPARGRFSNKLASKGVAGLSFTYF